MEASNVFSWNDGHRRWVGFWLGQEFWNQGIATRAVSDYLLVIRMADPTPVCHSKPNRDKFTMSTHTAKISWLRNEAVFTDNRYSRAHAWQFDGGCTVPASSSPHVVPLPFSDASAVDPEEAFVASLSSCHMLWFLSIAAKRGFVVDSYRDDAQGVMEKCADGKLTITVVTLRPCVTFSGDQIPSEADIHAMHHQAHEECFIARSVKTLVRCEPVLRGIC